MRTVTDCQHTWAGPAYSAQKCFSLCYFILFLRGILEKTAPLVFGVRS